jgi:hypothetical protein
MSSFFMLTHYLQQILRYTPLQAGIGYIPLAAAVVAASAASQQGHSAFRRARS